VTLCCIISEIKRDIDRNSQFLSRVSTLDDHRNLISDKAAKAHKWKNHFEQLLNHPSVPCPDLPSTVQEDQRACQEPSELEVHTAVRKLKNGKAPGLCGITAEMLKESGDVGIL